MDLKDAKTVEVTTYDFKGVNLRALMIDGGLWFKVQDVAVAIGYAEKHISTSMRKVINSEEHMLLTLESVTAPELTGLFGKRASVVALVSESGLFKFLLRAQRTRPVAREFQDWVTQTVLPSVRKDGGLFLRKFLGHPRAYISFRYRNHLAPRAKPARAFPRHGHAIRRQWFRYRDFSVICQMVNQRSMRAPPPHRLQKGRPMTAATTRPVTTLLATLDTARDHVWSTGRAAIGAASAVEALELRRVSDAASCLMTAAVELFGAALDLAEGCPTEGHRDLNAGGRKAQGLALSLWVAEAKMREVRMILDGGKGSEATLRREIADEVAAERSARVPKAA